MKLSLRPTASLLRTLWTSVPFVAAMALLVLAWLAVTAIDARNVRIREVLQHQITVRLEERVRNWENSLLPQLDTMIHEASAPGARWSRLEPRWRRNFGWFDALYVWRPLPVPQDGDGPPLVRFAFPATTAVSHTEDDCLPLDDLDTIASPLEQLLDAWARACQGFDSNAKDRAATELATALMNDRRPADALRVLDLVDPVPDGSLLEADRLDSVLNLRLTRIRAMSGLAEPSTVLALREALIRAITRLDAPELESSLYMVNSQLLALDAAGYDTLTLHSLVSRAERRLAAYREIRETAARPPSDASEVAKFTWDQYSANPYLLYTQKLHHPQLGGVALQLRQRQLVADFMASTLDFSVPLSVVDISDHVVAGASDPDTNGPFVAFSQTLRHLQVRVSASALQQQLAENSDFTKFWVAATVLVCIVLGLFAVALQARANRRHRALLQRQRDFTARVTHELKTPIAGMRVMAESLAIGAFHDDAQRLEMAGRIIEEADRLTERVNEILALSRTRTLPKPEPFDLEEPLMELVEHWGPRYAFAHIRLRADFEPVDPVLGDANALRDAVGCLLDNALKYRREGIESEVELTLSATEHEAVIAVTDNGLGVPAKDRKTIFEPYVRVEGPNRGKSGGHGLGLAQVAAIVAQHQGRVLCKDGKDGGTRFEIHLPLAT